MNPRLALKNRSLIYRYPRFFSAFLTTTGLLIFFSKPIYDFLIRDDIVIDVEELKRNHKSRFSKP